MPTPRTKVKKSLTARPRSIGDIAEASKLGVNATADILQSLLEDGEVIMEPLQDDDHAAPALGYRRS